MRGKFETTNLSNLQDSRFMKFWHLSGLLPVILVILLLEAAPMVAAPT
jgi:hypothetical protein